MRKYYVFILLILVIILVSPFVIKSERFEDNLLEEILLVSKSDFYSEEINIGGSILDDYLDEKQIYDLNNDIINFLGIQGQETQENIFEMDLYNNYYNVDYFQDKGYGQLNLWKKVSSDEFFAYSINTYEIGSSENGETYLYFNLIKNHQKYNFNDIIYDIEKIFQAFNKEIEITSCLTGVYKGNLNYQEKKVIIDDIVDLAEGKIVEEYNGENTMSYSIYTDKIENSIFNGKDMMNLNIGFSYDEIDDKTYIWIGSPILTIGY